jgi:hypothetical protein
LKLRRPRLALEIEQSNEKVQRCNEAILAVLDNIRNKSNEVIKCEQGQQ